MSNNLDNNAKNKINWADICEDESELPILDICDLPNIDNNIKLEYEKKEIEYNKNNSVWFSNKKLDFSKKITTVKKEEIVNKKKKQCMTCFPRGKVLRHVIKTDINENVLFHHDMHNRNMIIVTPKKHYTDITNFSEIELKTFFESIDKFCNNWNLNEYKLSYNHGTWKNHEHFHVKLQILEKVANRLRSDHFRVLKLINEYDVMSNVK